MSGPHRSQPAPTPTQAYQPREASPMLSVTVTMFKDMVESVMLLNEEACGGTR